MVAGIVLQAFATPKPSHWTATWYSVIYDPKSLFQLSTGQWHHSSHHFRWHLVFIGEMFGLWAAACPWSPILLTLNIQSWCWLDNSQHCGTHGWFFHSISGKFHKPPSTLDDPFQSLTQTTQLWFYCGCAVTVTSTTIHIGNLERCLDTFDQIMYIWSWIFFHFISGATLKASLYFLSNSKKLVLEYNYEYLSSGRLILRVC
jgi:hypothetical protein